jgi:hypothetical protein
VVRLLLVCGSKAGTYQHTCVASLDGELQSSKPCSCT